MKDIDFTGSDYEDTAQVLLESVDETSSSSLPPSKENSKSLIAIMVSGFRYVVYRLTTFYLRTPLKLFKPARFDALFYLRLLEKQAVQLQVPVRGKNAAASPSSNRGKWSALSRVLRNSSLGILIRSLNHHGWKIVPNTIAPPFIANSISGVVLYTSYLTFLPSYTSVVSLKDAFCSGALAGLMQATVSQPIEAIYQRSSVSEILSLTEKHHSLWKFGWDKLKKIGFSGVFYGGFTLSLLKESVGFAIYFSSFEYLKANGYHFVSTTPPSKNTNSNTNTMQLFNAGVSAAFFLQVIQYPFNKFLKIHISNLELQNELEFNILRKPLHENWAIYSKSYSSTFRVINKLCSMERTHFTQWAYKGFWRNTLAIIPGTTASLLALEYLRSYTKTSHPQSVTLAS